MSGAKCSACGLELPHAAALRDHLRTSVTCNPTYAGIDLSKSPWQDAVLTATEVTEKLERWQKDLLSKYPHSPDDIDRMIEQRVYEVVRQLTADFDRVLAGAVGRIKKLEKQAETVGLNPQIHRTMRERPDYVNMMSEDEDLLEDGYRGWPVPKDKVIF